MNKYLDVIEELALSTTIYVILSLIIGSYIDSNMPKFNKTKSKYKILIEIVIQSIIIVISCYFIKILGKQIRTKDTFYSDFSADITLAVVFVGTQVNYLKKIGHFKDYILTIN